MKCKYKQTIYQMVIDISVLPICERNYT